MLARIAAFEFRYQLRQPAFWVVSLLFALFGFGIIAASDNISLSGSGGNVFVNSPVTLMVANMAFSVFFMLGSASLVANAVARDSTTGFGSIIYSTPLTRMTYILGRFFGSFFAAALAFVSVSIGMALGTLMPWVDPETLGAFNFTHYAYAYLVFGVTNVFIASAILFALATATRSMMASYVGVIGILILYFVSTNTLLDKPETREIGAWLDPFGAGALFELTRYWTAEESNTRLLPLTGMFLGNRLLWLGVAVGFIILSLALFNRGARGTQEKKTAKLARKTKETKAAPAPRPLASPKYGLPQSLVQFAARTRFEMGLIFKSPAYLILMAFGFFMAFMSLLFGGEMYGVRTFPQTRDVIQMLQGSFSLISLVIAIYYSGELVWRDQDRKIHEIVDSSSAQDWTFIVPKAMALSLVLVSTLLMSVIAGVVSQTIKGWYDYELGKYLTWYVLPDAFDMILFAILAIFVQSLSPNRFVGWAIMVLYIISTIVAGSLGFDHYLYTYGSGPMVPLSDLNGTAGFESLRAVTSAYWGVFALILMVISYALWRRGSETRFKPRFDRAPRRLKGPAGIIGGLALVAFVALGALVYVNTNVWNTYERKQTTEARLARMEKELLPFENLRQPAVTDVKLAVDLFPQDRRMTTLGTYVVRNNTDQPLETIHLRWPRETDMLKLEVEGAKLDKEWTEHAYRIYRFDTPLQPGQSRTVSFETAFGQRGFGVGNLMTSIVDNGTFVNNGAFAPAIGMDRGGLLTDRTKRRKHGLEPELRMRDLDDDFGQQQNYIGADWVNADITVSTVADQTPIAPGYKVSDTVKDGRRTARFVTEAPILHFFSVQSARFELAQKTHAGVSLEVYHHPSHGQHAPRMLTALERGLDYFQSAFGPYQFRQARIIEFPGYSSFAQAFANTMPYSESIGFNADLRKPDAVDYVTFVTAHELAHQWWAHQIVGANVQGATTLSETLAEYSALMVMEKMYGADQIRRFLKYDLDNYLRSRGGERLGERTLERVEASQGYIHYRKGGHVLYLLRDQMGEDAVNRALSKLLAAHKFGNAPYPRSVDLIAALRAEAPADKQALITDLFQKITLYDLKVTSVRASERADGKWDVVLQIDARKLHADDKGAETPASLEEEMEIGLFAAPLGYGAFKPDDVIAIERHTIRSGPQTIRLVANTKPTYAGVDPYTRWIDRNTEDNVIKVE